MTTRTHTETSAAQLQDSSTAPQQQSLQPFELTDEEVALLHDALRHGSHMVPVASTGLPVGVSVLPLLAYRHRIWEAMGFESFEDYLECEFYELGFTPRGAAVEPAIRYYASYGLSPATISAITALPQDRIEHVLASFNGRTFTPLRPFTPAR